MLSFLYNKFKGILPRQPLLSEALVICLARLYAKITPRRSHLEDHSQNTESSNILTAMGFVYRLKMEASPSGETQALFNRAITASQLARSAVVVFFFFLLTQHHSLLGPRLSHLDLVFSFAFAALLFSSAEDSQTFTRTPQKQAQTFPITKRLVTKTIS